jgi:hypothetical protein
VLSLTDGIVTDLFFGQGGAKSSGLPNLRNEFGRTRPGEFNAWILEIGLKDGTDATPS